MPTTPPTLTPPGTPPQTNDTANFDARADSLVLWLSTMVSEMTAALANVYDNAVDAFSNALAAAASALDAQTQRIAAEAAAQAAANAAGAQVWVSGTLYAYGDRVWSPSSSLVYRRTVPGAGTTDPSIDPTNWALAAILAGAPVIHGGTTGLVNPNEHALFVNAAQSQATLPSTPQVGDALELEFSNGRLDNSFDLNGQTLTHAGIARTGVITCDETRPVRIRFWGAANGGWRFF